MRALAGIILTAVALAPAGGAPAEDASGDPHRTVRGMTVSCQTWGWEWGTDEMVEAMRQLRALGVNWITIHPYAGIRADGSVVMHRRWYDDTSWLTRPIDEAHRLGLKIMIKPHLAYWGSPFRWRGDIAFETDAQWQRFFRQYQLWVTRAAEVCAEADAFVVGTELDRTLHRPDDWRRVIAAVRGRFDGPITYAANWTHFEQVSFWDAVDVIGIQGYFPVADRAGLPEPEALRLAWADRLDRLDAFARRHNRKVVLAELGYSRSDRAAVRPWEGREGGEDAEETQRRCLAAALEAIDGHEAVVGAFLWKWFAGPTTRENYLMSTPAMRAVIADHWND
jgi:sugar phosphate isomerase/epimerase